MWKFILKFTVLNISWNIEKYNTLRNFFIKIFLWKNIYIMNSSFKSYPQFLLNDIILKKLLKKIDKLKKILYNLIIMPKISWKFIIFNV